MNLLSDLVCRIKVANISKTLSVEVQKSNFCIKILSTLYRLGYIRGFIIKDNKTVVVLLKYLNNMSVIRNITVISTPGRKIYFKAKDIQSKLKNKDSGFYIVSTSKGIMTDEEAVMYSIGGEMLIKIT